MSTTTDTTPELLRIGEVARLVETTLRTIRYYEETGLVPPSGRTAGGFRLYTDDDIARLALVRDMKPLDFSLEEMRDLLHARVRLAEPGIAAVERDALLARLGMFATVAEERCRRLREKLASATSLATALNREVEDLRRVRVEDLRRVRVEDLRRVRKARR